MTNLSLKDWTGPGAWEFKYLPPDADLLAEWAEHDAARNTARHPEQPTYPVPFVDKAVAERMRT